MALRCRHPGGRARRRPGRAGPVRRPARLAARWAACWPSGAASVRRLGYGPVRDTLLQAGVVTADGVVAKAGGPTVKNVSGFDLCRLLVGSLGTLAFIGDVILRTRPRPRCRRLVPGRRAPTRSRCRALYRPRRILWDGTTTWVRLEGHPDDVAGRRRWPGLAEVDGPPALPTGGRASLPPGELRGPHGPVRGRGRRRRRAPGPARRRAAALDAGGGRRSTERLKARFDPTGRLNPGRDLAADRSVTAARHGWRVPVAPPARAGRCRHVPWAGGGGRHPVDEAELGTVAPDGPAPGRRRAGLLRELWPVPAPLPDVPGDGGGGAVAAGSHRRHAARSSGRAPRRTTSSCHSWTTCVQCRGCETACPSGVPFGRLMEGTRATLAADHRFTPRWQRLAYRDPRPPPAAAGRVRGRWPSRSGSTWCPSASACPACRCAGRRCGRAGPTCGCSPAA